MTKTGKLVLAIGIIALVGCIAAAVDFFRILSEPPGILVGEAISPDGVYKATIRATGDDSPGSCSWLDLESRQRPSPPNSLTDDVFMASAPRKSFRKIRWDGKRSLIVTYSAGPLNPAFNSWRDVKVTYVQSAK